MLVSVAVIFGAGAMLIVGVYAAALTQDMKMQGLLWVPSSGPRSQAQGLWPVDLAAHSMRDLPGPGIGPVCTLHH